MIRSEDRVAGECEGAKGPPRMELMPQKCREACKNAKREKERKYYVAKGNFATFSNKKYEKRLVEKDVESV